MKIIALTKYSRLGASSRLRTFQFLPYLEAAGIKVIVCPLFDDEYLTTFYEGRGRSVKSVLRRYAARARDLRIASGADLFWVEKEALPYLPYWMEHALMPAGVPYVVDYDDAIFHNYDLSSRAWIRCLLGRKIDRLMARADLVIVGNSYLAGRAHSAGAKAVKILPTVVDMDHYPLADIHRKDSLFRVGWIGTPVTWNTYGRSLFKVLTRQFAGENVEFVAIGATNSQKNEDGVCLLPWTEESEGRLVSSLSVGLMPLEDTPWARGKCAYKIIQYLACGVPVVASSIGANCEVVKSGKNGFMASSPDDWGAAIYTLLADPALGRRMGLYGRQQVAREYSLNAVAPQLTAIFNNLVCAR